MSGRNTSRGVTRGRQRVPLARRENEVQRLVTFSKRRTGLFKKASEMSTLCGTEIAMVVFSPSGKAFSFGNPDMNRVLTKYFGEIPNREANIPEHIIRAHQEAKMRAMTSQINVLEAQIDEEKMVDQALREAEKDAAVFPGDDKSYISAIALRGNGDFLAAKNGSVLCLDDLHLAEAIAIKDGSIRVLLPL
nr:agamous-like MADS-box protein AGL61 [Ipomoea batatas]